MEKVRIQNIKTGRMIDLSRKAVDLLKTNGKFGDFDELEVVSPSTPLLRSKDFVPPVNSGAQKMDQENLTEKEEEKDLTFDELTSTEIGEDLLPEVEEGQEFVSFEVIDKSATKPKKKK
jgi:hypothetical protein